MTKETDDVKKGVDNVVKKVDPTKPHTQDDSGGHSPPPPPPPIPPKTPKNPGDGEG